MKKKKNKLLVFGTLIISLLVIFVYSTSAVYIAGNEFNVIKNYDQTLSGVYSINYQYIIYSTANLTLHSNYTSFKDNFIKVIFNALSVDILTDTYNNATYQQLRDNWMNGYYLFSDTVGPVQQRVYLTEFIQNLNELIQYHKNIYNDKLFGAAQPDFVMQSLVRYNNNFKMIFLENLEGFLNALADVAFIPTADYKNIVYSSMFALSSEDAVDIFDEDIYNGYGLYTDVTVDIKIVYPVQTHFSFNSALKYIQNPRTWDFIPVQLISIIMQFVIFIVSIGLMFKLFKTLRG